MIPDGRGRHCNHCKKTVIDFSTWGDKELYNFWKDNKEPVCGRFLASQVGVQLHIPYQPNSRLYRLTIALGLTLLFVPTPQVSAQQGAPKMEQTTPMTHKNEPEKSDTCELQGHFFNDDQQPLVGVRLAVYTHVVVKHQGLELVRTQVFGDYDGSYRICDLPPGKYTVFAIFKGYHTLMRKIELKLNIVTNFNMMMIRQEEYVMGETISVKKK